MLSLWLWDVLELTLHFDARTMHVAAAVTKRRIAGTEYVSWLLFLIDQTATIQNVC